MSTKSDTFLLDAIKKPGSSSAGRLSSLDGFRFGIGFFVAGLLIAVILGGLTWAFVYLFQMR